MKIGQICESRLPSPSLTHSPTRPPPVRGQFPALSDPWVARALTGAFAGPSQGRTLYCPVAAVHLPAHRIYPLDLSVGSRATSSDLSVGSFRWIYPLDLSVGSFHWMAATHRCSQLSLAHSITAAGPAGAAVVSTEHTPRRPPPPRPRLPRAGLTQGGVKGGIRAPWGPNNRGWCTNNRAVAGDLY